MSRFEFHLDSVWTWCGLYLDSVGNYLDSVGNRLGLNLDSVRTRFRFALGTGYGPVLSYASPPHPNTVLSVFVRPLMYRIRP